MAWNRDLWKEAADVDDLIDGLVDEFGHKRGYNTTSVGSGVVEFQKTSTPRLLAGLTSGVRLIITSRASETSVEYREHVKEYLVKVPIFIVALAILPILALPALLLLALAAYGTYQQYMLTEDLRKEPTSISP